MDRLKKIQGCLVGGVVGDMVGSPIEMAPLDQVDRYIKEHLIPKNFEGVVRDHNGIFPFGQYTDDGQLTRELSLSLVSDQHTFIHGFVGRLKLVFSTNQVVGYGKSTAQAVQNLIEGKHWSVSGVESIGNGSAMRAAPIGLYFDNVKDIKKYSKYQSMVTHKTEQAYFGSTLMALAVHKLLEMNTWDPDEFFSFLVGETSEFEWSRQVQKMRGFLHTNKHNLLTEIKYIEKYDREGMPAFAVSSVLWSLVSFAKNPHSFWDTIEMAVWCGGDVDSTAAMAGNLSGAFLGLDAIPLEVRRLPHDKGKYGYEFFLELGQLFIE